MRKIFWDGIPFLGVDGTRIISVGQGSSQVAAEKTILPLKREGSRIE